MSLLLFAKGEWLEAQLYAIGSIQLIIQHSNVSLEHLDKARKILEKVKKEDAEIVDKIDPNEKLNDQMVSNILALVKVHPSSSIAVANKVSFQEKINIKADLGKCLGDLALKRISCSSFFSFLSLNFLIFIYLFIFSETFRPILDT